MIQTIILDKYRIGSLQGQSILSYLSTFLCKWSYFPSGLIQYITNIYLWLPGQLIIIKRSHIGVLILFTIFEMYCRCVSYRNLKKYSLYEVLMQIVKMNNIFLCMFYNEHIQSYNSIIHGIQVLARMVNLRYCPHFTSVFV